MTDSFEEFIKPASCTRHARALAKFAWDYQEKKIDELKRQLEGAKMVSDSMLAAGQILQADKNRVDWLEAHPLQTEIRGGNEDGHMGKAWAISAHSGTFREAIDLIMSLEKPKIPPVSELAEGA